MFHSHPPDTLQASHKTHSPQPLEVEEIPLLPHKASFTEHQGQFFDCLCTSLEILLESTQFTVSIFQSGSTTHLHHHNIPCCPKLVPGQLEIKYVQEGQDRNLSQDCIQFPINPRFTEHFWHQSKYFFALVGHQNDYLNTFSTAMSLPTVFIRNTVPSISSLVFGTPHRRM